MDQTKRLKGLEQENAKLKRLKSCPHKMKLMPPRDETGETPDVLILPESKIPSHLKRRSLD